VSRRVVVALIAVSSSIAWPSIVAADIVGGGSDGESLEAHVKKSSGGSVVASDSPERGPRCSWRLADWLTVRLEGDSRQMGAHYRNAETREFTAEPGPGVVALYFVQCPYGTGPGSYRWGQLAEFVDRQAVIDAAYDEAVSKVPLPSLNISPRPDVGVPAQLGIWLAVNDPGQVNAFAEVGPVWASVTARFTGTTWNMGNGDVVECAGLGTPYPEGSGTYEQGPCGYTYTRVGEAEVHRVSAVGHWQVQLITSDGANQALDPIERTFEFDYEVYEIVTVVEE
jgi:hypothetical protein